MMSSSLSFLLEEIIAENALQHFGATLLWNKPTSDQLPVDVIFTKLEQVKRIFSVGNTTETVHDIFDEKALLKSSMYLQVLQLCPHIVENLCWSVLPGEQDVGEAEQETSEYKKMLATLHSMEVFFAGIALSLIISLHRQVKRHIYNRCLGSFDVPMLEDVSQFLCEHILCRLCQAIGNMWSTTSMENWKSYIMQITYRHFVKMRVSELFEIIVDFPDSEPAIQDLKLCLKKVPYKEQLVSCLDDNFKRRLLHQGVNTADIITQYIASVKALQVIDPTGSMLERVCGPVRDYLYSRDDTVRCIVASLTNESDSDLVEVLGEGDNDSDSDREEQDFDLWEPHQTDVLPGTMPAMRYSADILSLLVNIYGSSQLFVSEYRNMLADRLLQLCSYDTTREMCTLELLKQRFGESSLHFCEVMLKDFGDSRRISSTVTTKAFLDKEDDSDPEIHGVIMSSEFWPAFREETFQIPDFVQRRLDLYSDEFKKLKGMRRLIWKLYLGTVEVEIFYRGQTTTIAASPFRAVLIYKFQMNCQWSVDSLAHSLKAHPRLVRKHLGFWVSHGLLKEVSSDVYELIQEQNFNRASTTQRQYDEDPVMETDQDRLDDNSEVYWNYVKHMLTNLGTLTLDRIYSMMGMFGMQETTKKTLGLNELRAFLTKKTQKQELVYNNGYYSLP